MASIEIDPIILNLKANVEADLLNAWNASLRSGLTAVRGSTARFEGDLRQGYRITPARINGGEIEGSLDNTTPDSLYRERGRGPGKMPPFREGSALGRWARAKGVAPFVVARKIGREGTERWKRNRNALGIDRTSTEESIKPQRGGVIDIVRTSIIERANALRY